jgi:hypothetical protein
MRRPAAAATVYALALIACHRSGPTPAAQETVVRGSVLVTGTGFEQHLLLATRAGRRVLHATPGDSAALVRVAGPNVELSVRGRDEGNTFRVHGFTVEAVSASPVVDGVLRGDADHLSVETAKGVVTLGNPPPALRGMIGARVWIQGPLDRGPNAYGVIVPR